MAIKSGFFDSVDGDRLYNAGDIGRYLGKVVGSGVYPIPGSDLMVAAGTGMQVQVLPGYAMLEAHWMENDARISIEIPKADATLDRIDAVIMKLNRAQRECTIELKKGTASSNPAIPSMERSETTMEWCLAKIYVKAKTTYIGVNNITDMRASNLCGWITGLVSKADGAGTEIKYVICDTEADVQRKTLYLDGYKRKDGDIILVNFAKGIDVADSTLYIPGFGEFPMRYKGKPTLGKSVKSGMIVMIRWDDTGQRWDVIGLLNEEQLSGFNLYGQLSDTGLVGSGHTVGQILSAMSQKSIFMTHLTQSGITGLGDMTGYENGFIRITKAQGYGSAQIVEIYGKTKYKWKDASNMDNPWNEVEYPVNETGNYFGICTTAIDVATKEVSIEGITKLYNGLIITVMFENGISADGMIGKLYVNGIQDSGYCYIQTHLRNNATAERRTLNFVYRGGTWFSIG